MYETDESMQSGVKMLPGHEMVSRECFNVRRDLLNSHEHNLMQRALR